MAEAGFPASAKLEKESNTVDFSAFIGQFLVGLSRAMILFVVCAGLSFVLGVLRIPNIAHGSLYMIGAFATFTLSKLIGGSAGFWIALILAHLLVALISFIAERALFCHLYQREHLMLLLFTFALSLILGDLVKIVWGAEYRSVSPPALLKGTLSIFGGASLPRYNLFLLIIGPLVAVALWLFTNKTKIGKISRAAAVDREMVGVLGINVSWVFAIAFVIGCYLAGVGGALVAPTASIIIGMDHSLIIEAFLIVTIGGLGNMWGALVGSLIFGVTQSVGVLIWPQFAIVFPYLAVVIVLLLRPQGLLKSVW